MKHKAQNSLDNYCLIGCMKKGISREERYIPDKNIQELIDCQLTEEEINAIQVSMSYYNLRNHDKPIGDIDVGYGGDLYLKLEKQKGMWCKDE